MNQAEQGCSSGLTCTVNRNAAITCPWLLARDRSTSRDRILVVPSHMDSTCGEEETVEEHEGAFAGAAAKKGSVRGERHRAEVRDTKDICRDVLSQQVEGSSGPSSIAVLGNSTRNTSCPSWAQQEGSEGRAAPPAVSLGGLCSPLSVPLAGNQSAMQGIW